MPDEVHKPPARICPHCGKEIAKLPKKTRDLGLLLHMLTYRVPIEKDICEGWIEAARVHCKMSPERLAMLRASDHARHWPRMLQRRAARLAYFEAHGELPPRWKGILPGEPDRRVQLAGLIRYRKGGLARLKSKYRKHPETAEIKLANRYLATRRIRSKARRSVALDDVMFRLLAQLRLQGGKLSLRTYESLQSCMLPDDALGGRPRQQGDRNGSPAEKTEAKERGEPSRMVPPHAPAPQKQVGT